MSEKKQFVVLLCLLAASLLLLWYATVHLGHVAIGG